MFEKLNPKAIPLSLLRRAVLSAAVAAFFCWLAPKIGIFERQLSWREHFAITCLALFVAAVWEWQIDPDDFGLVPPSDDQQK